MKTPSFQTILPNIIKNADLREPQIESFKALEKFHENSSSREAGIILPVGCGKSGCITITPFAFKSKRTLVIAPSVAIAKQLYDDFDPNKSFYKKCKILKNDFPEPVEIRGTETNISDLKEADVVITNIQQLQRKDNKWMKALSDDFFDLIVFDEGHHSVAETWTALKNKFENAKIVNYSATPERADGQIMSGEVIYSFPIVKAISSGYVKELKGIVLNPTTLKYVRREDNREVEVSLDEVIRLGEEDASFRRSIVTSKETLDTIVDASLSQLDNIRMSTGENRLKIIASALNYEHCIQVVQAYRERRYNVDYVHSRLDGRTNETVLNKLNNHELDIIVQVRKLSEGFDHPYLSVAAIFSVFSNLSPFVQFVGRIMRVITQNNPSDPLNKGIVVFHAGSNIASQWSDFKKFSVADQEYYSQLFQLEELSVSGGSTNRNTDANPIIVTEPKIVVKEQTEVRLSELNLIDDPETIRALEYLKSKGHTGNINIDELLSRVPVTKVRKRQAKRQALPDIVKTHAARILSKHKINPNAKNLDKSFIKTNLIYLISKINIQINNLVGKKSGQRSEFNIDELNLVDEKLPEILLLIDRDIENGKN